MKKMIIVAACLLACMVSCVSEKTPEEKVKDLITARFDSLALNCKVVSVALKDTLMSKVSSDPTYKQLYKKWDDMLTTGVSLSSSEYIQAREALIQYRAAWVGEPVAVTYTCIVECDELLLKSMIESGEFAIALDYSRILDLDK